MVNVTALVVLCAISLMANLFLVLYVIRLHHWLKYWEDAYRDAIAPIEPITHDPYAKYYTGEVYDGISVP